MKSEGVVLTRPSYSMQAGISEMKGDTNKQQSQINGSDKDLISNNLPSVQELMEKKETSPYSISVSEKAVIDIIERANKAIQGINTTFEFSIHEKTHQIMVKVINRETNEVIREIPPEKILDMVAKMWEMAGIFVDERR